MTPTGVEETLPRQLPGRVSSFRPLTVALSVVALALLLALVFDRWDNTIAVEYARGAAVGRLSPRRIALQHTITQGFSMLPGLAALLSIHWGDPDLSDQFDAFAEELHLEHRTSIRTLQRVDAGVIIHVWPMAGNEGALGRDLRQDARAAVRNDYLRAVADTEFRIALSGPIPLYQGGDGLIGRLRVTVPDGEGPVLVAAVLDLPEVISRSGLADTTSVRWLVRDQDGTRIAGEPDSIMAGLDPVILPVRLVDRSWSIEGVPREGWSPAIANRRASRRVVLGLIAGLLGALGYLFQSRLLSRLESTRLRELRAAEEHFALLFQLVPDGVALIRSDSDRYVQVNDAFCAVTGRSREELVGGTVTEKGVWSNPGERTRVIAAIRETGAAIDLPFTVARPDGSLRETLVSSRRIDLDGEPHCLTVVHDVHVRLTLERRLVASQRLEAIGRLAGGIAHDFNNLITAIGGYAGLALSATAEGDPRQVELREIQLASNRAAGLTRQLLTFARRQVVLPRRVDLASLLHGIAPLLRRLVGEQGTVDILVAGSPIPVTVDPSQLEHAIVNLVVNARDAMPGGGVVTIRVARQEGFSVLEVRDTGMGIAPSAMPHLFEPFYTTKPPGKGTGLGLATVYGIVEQAGGTIHVASEPGHGTTFTIALPTTESAPNDDEVVERRELPRGSEHILVVDDESQIRDICDRLLTRLGYTVTIASEGGEALAFLQANPAVPIDLVLTDLVMPGMGGLELRTAIAAVDPTLPLVLMSGYSEDALMIEANQGAFLPKPFTAEELAIAVRQALGAARRPD